MKYRSAVVAVLLVLCLLITSQAGAGGILEFLFGSKPRIVQWFAPSADGDLHARNPFTLGEETFDLEGNGTRVVLDSGIPVERGLVLVGTVGPKTGPSTVPRWTARVDGSDQLLEVVDGPRPSDDQEQWLSYMVSRARYMRGSGARFRGFRTKTAPFYFAVDSGLLLQGAHSVEVFLWTGRNQGASVVLPFRIVRPVDESTGKPVPSEYEASSQQTYTMPPAGASWPTTPPSATWPPPPPPASMPSGWQGTQLNQLATPPSASSWPGGPVLNTLASFQTPTQWACWGDIVQTAKFVGYGDVCRRPIGPAYFSPHGGATPEPFVFLVVRAGRIDRFQTYEFVLNGVRCREQDDGDGVVVVADFRGGDRVAPIVDGRALGEVVVRPAQGVWYLVEAK